MLNKPTVWNRMCAALQDEVSADTLEAYLRASLAVYEALEHPESHRESVQEAGKNAWTLPTSTKAEVVCTWNAFVLQTLGDRFLETDYEGHFFCAPWGSVLQVRRPLTLGGRRLSTMEQFVFNVTCEGVNLGPPFERDIMTGNFSPTTKFEYGDPNEEPNH